MLETVDVGERSLEACRARFVENPSRYAST